MAPGGLVSEGSLTEIDTAAAQQSVIVVEGNVLSLGDGTLWFVELHQ